MTMEKINQLESLLINFHSDDTLYDGESYREEKKKIFDFVESEIESACKKAKIEENNYWIDFKNKDWTNLIHTTSLQNRIKELNAPLDEIKK